MCLKFLYHFCKLNILASWNLQWLLTFKHKIQKGAGIMVVGCVQDKIWEAFIIKLLYM